MLFRPFLIIYGHFLPKLFIFLAPSVPYIGQIHGLEASKIPKMGNFRGFLEFFGPHHAVYDNLWVLRTLEHVSDHFPSKPIPFWPARSPKMFQN